MKALFIIFHGFDESNGISKKIRYQIAALRACGVDVRTCYYDVSADGHRRWMVDDTVIEDFGTGNWAKIRKRFCFNAIIRYAQQENIEFVYIRSYHNANPFTVHLVKELKKQGSRIVIEIPTYPYDQEYIYMRMKLSLLIDKICRCKLARQTDGIVTFSNAEQIFGAPTIRISNGIDFNAIPLRTHISDISKEMHFIGVAEVHYWHGYDRLIRGMAEYYRLNPDYKVYFHIVGPISGDRERNDILPVIRENKLEPYVMLHGPRHGAELEALFAQADFAIGSLARHRSGISQIKTLKNREYAARGFAFMYSEIDEDFEQMPYILKVAADETPINVKQLIAFRKKLQMTPSDIRASIHLLSWQCQMQKVLNQLNLKPVHKIP